MQAPADPARWFVVEQDGVVRHFTPTSSVAQTFIDLADRVVSPADGSHQEMGLLGMAFHPQYPADPRVFLSYTVEGPTLVIAEFQLASDGASLDPASEHVLITIHKPEGIPLHNGGGMAFGPDGYLYIGVGDGGGQGDGRYGNAQSLRNLLGKMLRIDVADTRGPVPYRIPTDNPYASGAHCGATGAVDAGPCAEIYAYGFRNPWRWSFDRATGELWLGDVGHGRWEEVNNVTRGGNYGWRCREGARDWSTSGCTLTDLIDPVAEYSHDEGRSVTGGYVYRGAQNTSLRGRYLFADYVTGTIWAWIPENANGTRTPTRILDSGLSISSFAEDLDGELYVTDRGGGVYRLEFTGGSGGQVPPRLSQTGCMNASNPKEPAAGLVPYAVNAPLWSDGADKDRWIALPDGERILIGADGDWELPIGSVLIKSFRFGDQLIETRLFMRHPDGAWGGFSYAWNAEQTDALLVPGGATRPIFNGQDWIFPSESQCLECHTEAAGRTLGLESSQLNRLFTYGATGRTANQLFTLNHLGLLTPALTDPALVPALADPANTNASVATRARAYLHANCSHCHRPGGPTQSGMDLRDTTAFAEMNACNVPPQLGDLGLGADARLITPGHAATSILVSRMSRRDEHAMPPLSTNRVDTAGVALVSEWIDGLTGC